MILVLEVGAIRNWEWTECTVIVDQGCQNEKGKNDRWRIIYLDYALVVELKVAAYIDDI